MYNSNNSKNYPRVIKFADWQSIFLRNKLPTTCAVLILSVTRKVKYKIHIPKITFRFLLGVCKHTGQGWGVTFGANSRDFAPHNSLAQKVLAWRQKSNMRNLLFLRSCKRLEFLDAIYALFLLLIFLWRNYRCSTSAITFSS